MTEQTAVISPFIRKVSELAEVIYKEKGYVTVNEVLIKLDKEKKYSNEQYRLQSNRVYNAFRFLQKYSWALWLEFRKRKKMFNRLYSKYEHYNAVEEMWDNEKFRELYDMHIFSRKQMLESFIESRIFKDFVKDLSEAGILFLMSGRGTHHYVIPEFYDYISYKYNNMLTSSQILRNQIEAFKEEQIMLPEGVSIEKLEQISYDLLKAFEIKRENSAQPPVQSPLEIVEDKLVMHYADMDDDVFYPIEYDNEDWVIIKNKEGQIRIYEVMESE